ncbi:helicase HerA-like domain-containing protein [Acuticoccus sediminis]|uniref:helicase HerA-like domain-containing protein n=1 Tax=Acuticoccus sediminis TaxID=2184697 RepID=UPI001CFF2106|nr:helicase HerA-like domain-containing protein [Acuticoccus sediminis]
MSILNDTEVYVGTAETPQYLRLDMANRHGLITGATGTGKTVTLQILAEGFSRAGVPCFCADVKGDLAGLSMQGEPKDFLLKRAAAIGLGDDYAFEASPTVFWDLFGAAGHPIRTTVTEMGPLMLARLLELTEVQEGVLAIAFKLADDQGLPILDLKDLRALMVHVADQASTLSRDYGLVSERSIGAIQRALLTLEQQGGNRFFGEPALKITDLMQVRDGRGVVNILAADQLMLRPQLYATFLLWLLSELFETLPEVGDPEKPKLVFFFDEAHLLFDDAPPALIDTIERVARLIRSKGVGIIFVTQNPLDVPDVVLGQLGNRVQHALRAYTPRDQKAVRAAATTFRPNPALDTERVITELGVGEALVSTLGPKGVPSIVERTLIRPPSGRMGPITTEERAALMARSPVAGVYDTEIDRESAYEILAARATEAAEAAEAGDPAPPEAPKPGPRSEPEEDPGAVRRLWWFLFGGPSRRRLTSAQKAARGAARTAAAEAGERIGRAVAGATGAKIGKSIARGALGNLLRR